MTFIGNNFHSTTCILYVTLLDTRVLYMMLFVLKQVVDSFGLDSTSGIKSKKSILKNIVFYNMHMT